MDGLPFGGGFGGSGATQFGGGGFMPSPAGGENTYGAGGAKRSGGERRNNDETIRHVTIRQLYKDASIADDDNFMVDGHAVTNVLVVGKIMEVHETAVIIRYKVHDGTSSMDMQMYTQDDDPLAAQRKLELVRDRYVRVFGTMRRQPNGQLGMNVYSMKVVEDFNEVVYHNLQVIFQHLHLTRGGPPATLPHNAATQGGYGATPMAMPYGGAPAAAHAAGNTGGRTGDIHLDIMSIFNDPVQRRNTAGLTCADVEQQLRMQGMPYTVDQIKQSVEGHLANEGHVYTTTDDNHFRTAQDS
eukprot:CAMPEP_0119104068 /NCGR_PEP_ID=MMETSP1180-20130426/2380_1 /TAXON_ID=3052 ORGANISM="Chlamydomonas cf sp, Strain CCMP681" /NCGR_SAMPLE_ID=MMETSP1180 /ASSEMBLY_ACC=CAM_ASM_000741 /LENGTH=298 /DNA_ID=CAMNT_0007088737 /DNA_START=90 /DNA_END=986 /DNA_ORIENTATION=-